MRLILFLIFAAALWQGGGYFQSPNLTALSFALLFLPPVMLAVSLYLKKSLKGRILSSGPQLRQGSDSSLQFEVENRGRLPALGFRAELQSVYLRDRVSKKTRQNRRAAQSKMQPKKQGKTQWEKQRKKERRILTGGVDGQGTWRRDVPVQTPWCGLMEISVKRLYVFDYLKFFRCRVRKNQKLLAAVMPDCAPVLLRFSEDRDLLSEMMRSGQKGSAFPDSEVHQLREYRPGDGRRSIHWKQSARTDKTWVKEYSQEDTVVTLELELDLQILARQRAREAFSEEGRTISRGSLQPEGREILEITADRRPTETVYLRSFSGGDYQNGKWKIHRDMEIFETLRNGSTERAGAAYSQFRDLYFRMNWQYGEADIRELSVHRFNKKTTGAMDTYYAAALRTENGDDISARDTISYFERKDMNFDWDDTGWRYTDTQNIDMFTADNETLHQNYKREAQQVYTALPALRLSGFRQLQEENPRESLADITAFIRGTLREHGVYTRNPGVCPLSRDPVEYFFFENHKGYCQHFASAAVILYRLYDVPARYAAGYAVTPSEFEALPDGTYRAVVTDASAHAWPEVFREDIGWTPVEVTPGGAGASSALTDTPDADGEEDVVQDVLPLETPDGENADRTDRDTEAPAKSDTGNISAAGKLGAAAAAVLLVLLLLHVYRMLCRRAYQKMNSRQLFSRLLKILHFAGCLPDCDGTEEDFPKRLAEVVPGISEEAAAEAVAIVEREAFGPAQTASAQTASAQTALAQTAIAEAAGMDKAEVKAEAAAEETALVRQLCSQTAAALYTRLPRHRKLWFRYGRGFFVGKSDQKS